MRMVACGGDRRVRDRFGQPRLLHGAGQAEACRDQQQRLPLDRLPCLVRRDAFQRDDDRGRDKGGRHHRHQFERRCQNHGGQYGAGDPGLIVSRRGEIIHRADEIKVAIAPLVFRKITARLQQKRVARLERDVTDFHLQTIAVAGDGDHHRVVGRAEASLADRAADQRAGVRHHRLNERPFRAGIVEFEDLVGGRTEAADLLQLDDGIDNAYKDKAVACFQSLGGRHGRDHMPAAVDLHEKQPVESAQARLLDRASDKRTPLLDEHLQRILSRIVAWAHRGPPILEQVPAGEDEIHEAGQHERDTQPCDLEHAKGAARLGGYQSADDDVGARADQGAESAQHHGGVHGHEQLRHAEPMLLGPVPNRRHHQGDHGRVVHEGGEDTRAHHRSHLGRGQ